MEAVMEDGELLKKIVETVKDMVRETNVEFSDTGLYLETLDNAHIALIHLCLKKHGFRTFKIGRPICMGFDLGSLFKILKFGGKEETLTIKGKHKAGTVEISFESPNGKIITTFDMKLMNLKQDCIAVPAYKIDIAARMKSDTLHKVLTKLAEFGDSIRIDCNQTRIKFSVDGDLGCGTIVVHDVATLDDEDGAMIEMEGEPVQMSFMSKYLKMFTKACAFAKTVELAMSKEWPLTLEFKIDGKGYIRYYLAPKIENTDD